MATQSRNAEILKIIMLSLSAIRLLPHLIVLTFNKNNDVIKQDIRRWLHILHYDGEIRFGFLFLMTFYPEFRNLFYSRIGAVSLILNFLCRKMSTLFLSTPTVGEGLFIQHGFATIIAAKSIGKNCWINQQVTIGYSNDSDCPVLGDNVTVLAGAKVIGNVSIGNNSIIGANAVVVKDVPANCTVVGIPAHIIKQDGKKVSIKL